MLGSQRSRRFSIRRDKEREPAPVTFSTGTGPGAMPVVCVYCGSLRDDEGGWHPTEVQSPDATVSHGICPTCFAERFPEFQADQPG